MSTITREQAKDLRNAFQCWQQDYDPVEDKEQYDMFVLGVVAMDALLASLEAEPVAYIRDGFRADGVHFCGGIITAEEHERTKPALSDRYNWKHQPLYTAPPAPSVDDDLLHMAASAIDDLISNKDRSGAGVWADVPAKLRRAAMLHGASNSPVIPDSWVLVPVEPTPDMRDAYHQAQEEYEETDGLWSPDHQWKAMLAAAPHQEVK
ncbi:hypothetical protein [Enterobacter soli]|uniref:hypothetical protein n=1 Tax=Enterobacter soli TaxID=885040 RepID=UPI002F421531